MFSLILPKNKSSLLVPIFLIVSATVLNFTSDNFQQLLKYDARQIFQGEWWRIFTGHFLHTNANHLMLNLAAVAVLWLLHAEYYKPIKSLMFLILVCLLTGLGLYYFVPEIIWYVGLSGIIHGYFVWGAIEDIKHGIKTGYLLFTGVFIKVFYEQVYGADPNVADIIEANVAVDAHLVGTISGLILSVAFFCLQSFKPKKNQF